MLFFDSVAATLGWRYAFAGRSSLSFIARVAIAGLVLSIAVLVIVVSVINGFERELEKRVFAVLPHLSLYGRQPVATSGADIGRLESLPDVVAAEPFVQAVGIAAGNDKAQGMLLNGIVPETYGRVSQVGRFVESGALDGLRSGAFKVVLGARLAERIGVGLGDWVNLVVPDVVVTPAGAFPRQRRFTVVGLLRSHSELDNRAAFLHLEDAQRLLRLGDRIHGYQIKIQDFFQARSLGFSSRALLGDERFHARPWTTTHGNLHHAIRVQKTTMFVLLALLVAVATFNLVSTLVMTVEQRGSDIAVLKTMGAETGSLMGSFALFGTLIGGVGVLAGLALGYLGALLLPTLFASLSSAFNADLMSRYFIHYLPVDPRTGDILTIGVVAFALCVLATALPARRAATILPREVLAHE